MDAGTLHATSRDRGGTDLERVCDDSFGISLLDAKGFEYPAHQAVFIVTQRKLCTRGKFRSTLLCQFDGPRSALLYLLHTEVRLQ